VKIDVNPVYTSLACAPGRIAAGTRSGTVIVWEGGVEAEFWFLGGAPVTSLAALGLDLWLAADEEGTLWRISQLAEPILRGGIRAVTVTSDGSRVLVAGRELTLRPAGLDPLDSWIGGPSPTGRVRSVACSPSGTAFAVADRSLLLWRPESGSLRRDLSCQAVDFWDDDRLVAVGEEWIDVYELSSWTRVRSIRVAGVSCARVDRAAGRVYAGTARGEILSFDLSTGEGRSETPAETTRILALGPEAALTERIVHEGGRRLGRHSREDVEFWDLDPDRGIAATRDAESIRVWDLSRGIQRPETAEPPSPRVVLDGEGSLWMHGRDASERVLPGHYRAFARSRGAGLIAGVTVDAVLKIYDAAGLHLLFQQRIPADVVRVEFAPEEDHVGLLGLSELRVVALDSGREVSRASVPVPPDKTLFALGEGGKLAAIAPEWGPIRIHYDGRMLAEFPVSRELRGLRVRGDRLWIACLDAGPRRGRLLELDSIDVSYETLFAWRLSSRA
jgi:hypothetical protein